MKCNFISPHRSDVGRAILVRDKKDRIRSDSGGSQRNRGWISSFYLVTAVFLLSFNSSISCPLDNQSSYSKWRNPIHHLINFINEASVSNASKNEVLNWHRIVDSQLPKLLIIERFSFDLSYAPEVKSSRMATWSTDGGHPNTAEINFKPETAFTENQYGQMMNCFGKMQNKLLHEFSIALFKQNVPYNTCSTVLNKPFSSELFCLESNVLIFSLTPQNNLLWPV